MALAAALLSRKHTMTAEGTLMATVAVELKIGDRRMAANLSVPDRLMHLSELLPIVRRVSDAIVDAELAATAAEGRQVSCQMGCAACCRQLVPITEVEARAIGRLVADSSEPRRGTIQARFAAVRARLDAAGLTKRLDERYDWTTAEFKEMVQHYFRQAIPCPFLEDECCSIYSDRPLRCREYLVTSPAELCAQEDHSEIENVDMPVRVSQALAHLDRPQAGSQYVRWVPLSMALEWADEHPDEPPPRAGAELVAELFNQLRSPPSAE
jgi:Fe-S-cluster containining protein